MRVTTNAYTGNFLKNNNSLLSGLLKSETKILTQKKYTRASEDSVSAAKAAHVRKSISNLNIYDENCKTAKDLFCAAEDALYDIADKTFLNVYSKVDSIQDTMSQEELNIIAQEISELADHMIQNMNSDFAERQMFGSTSNDKTPFTVFSKVEVYDKDGNLVSTLGGELVSPPRDDQIIYSEIDEVKFPSKVVCYNDVPVNLSGDDLLKAVDGGTIRYFDESGKEVDSKVVSTNPPAGAKGDASDFPGTNPIYVDIGLGINYSNLEATALDMGLNGAKITGCGTDKDGDAQNLMQLIFDTATALRAGDRAAVSKNIDKLNTANGLVLDAITDLGIKQSNMDYHIDKNDVYRLSLLDKQNELEGCDIEEEITNWKTIDAAYNASLSMGSQVLPKSIFDFL